MWGPRLPTHVEPARSSPGAPRGGGGLPTSKPGLCAHTRDPDAAFSPDALVPAGTEAPDLSSAGFEVPTEYSSAAVRGYCCSVVEPPKLLEDFGRHVSTSTSGVSSSLISSLGLSLRWLDADKTLRWPGITFADRALYSPNSWRCAPTRRPRNNPNSGCPRGRDPTRIAGGLPQMAQMLRDRPHSRRRTRGPAARGRGGHTPRPPIGRRSVHRHEGFRVLLVPCHPPEKVV
jgi:hypothetical protein